MQVNLPQYLTVKFTGKSDNIDKVLITDKFSFTSDNNHQSGGKNDQSIIDELERKEDEMSKGDGDIFNTNENIDLKKVNADRNVSCREHAPDPRKIDKKDYNSKGFVIKGNSVNMNNVNPMQKESYSQPIQSDTTYYINPSNMTDSQRARFKTNAKLNKMTVQDYKNWLLLYRNDSTGLNDIQIKHLKLLLDDDYINEDMLIEARTSVSEEMQTEARIESEDQNIEVLDDSYYYNPINADVLYTNYLNLSKKEQVLNSNISTLNAYNADEIDELHPTKKLKHLKTYKDCDSCKTKYSSEILNTIRGKLSRKPT